MDETTQPEQPVEPVSEPLAMPYPEPFATPTITPDVPSSSQPLGAMPTIPPQTPYPQTTYPPQPTYPPNPYPPQPTYTPATPPPPAQAYVPRPMSTQPYPPTTYPPNQYPSGPMQPYGQPQPQVIYTQNQSFTGKAVIAYLLYFLGYVPGLIFNIMFINEANRVQKETGRTPSGVGCLWATLIASILPLAVGVLCSFWIIAGIIAS